MDIFELLHGWVTHVMPEDGTFYFRAFVDKDYLAPRAQWMRSDPFSPVREPPPMVNYAVYPVLRKTPTGVILEEFGQERFVCHSWKKQFACKTRAEALESLKRRRARQVSILKAQLAAAEEEHAFLSTYEANQ